MILCILVLIYIPLRRRLCARPDPYVRSNGGSNGGFEFTGKRHLDSLPKHIIVTRGYANVLQLEPSARTYLDELKSEKRIQDWHWMTTNSNVRSKFNDLNNGRTSVAAILLHTTC